MLWYPWDAQLPLEIGKYPPLVPMGRSSRSGTSSRGEYGERPLEGCRESMRSLRSALPSMGGTRRERARCCLTPAL
jgi:hypothetical protein